MGTVDETGILEEDQVFIQCEDRDSYDIEYIGNLKQSMAQSMIINGPVAVAKNPCMHPGDLRVLKAVDVKELRHMVNCIVFPSKGYRPIPNMCSGSDLDGDMYFVTWDPLLIPKTQVDPMDYSTNQKPKEKTSAIVIEDIINFFVEFMETDQIGRIANAHVALSDISEKGVHDPECIEFAKAFSIAIDFPKLGIVVKLPKAAEKFSYPDFMEKNAPSHESKKVIGLMYRKCKRIFMNEFIDDYVEPNPSLIVEGYENYLDEAKSCYFNYRHEIEKLMEMFGCRQESELFVGILLKANKSHESSEFSKLSNEKIKKLVATF
jgi:RNA-dependent RNA polymerase